ncbi:MAG: tRNA preQ1(34) S-adenosylmethionine ribosyltransferase-isomerase QueA [Candidatus Koribacter versatilis]|uniref:S-adenosylmethionine:tRNA ribosyltransferase-isomerase n=1 Tax=Candidatus Korobacter versatilis TaxID=658062 RepID=A0A932AAE3_9BACT|nr:tRNA preQ1(34) S-adenosylmethionine ribosyltransferase-isomerase QueA [Candidatus Koribacter versatilis]
MLVRDFHFHLPAGLIAQQPLADRAASRLLHLDRASGRIADRAFRDLPGLLRPDDLLVFNDTRVFPARLYGRRSGARSQPVSPNNPAAKGFLQGRVEVLLTKRLTGLSGNREPETENELWSALVRPGRKIGVGERLTFGEGNDELHAEVTARGEFGERTLRFESVADFFAALDRIGHVPLPPYIARADSAADRGRYQTIYARARGSVAAPTAGLHFTPGIFDQLRARGIEMANITLHVGLGTFQPVHAERVEDHKLHTESYSIALETAAQINAALAAKRRIVAVGTTTVRTLEFVASQNDGRIVSSTGEADIFIFPGFRFRAVGALLTNFHLPESTLLMLVSAFAGRDHTLAAYQHAVREKYRFYSYGDCMFIG